MKQLKPALHLDGSLCLFLALMLLILPLPWVLAAILAAVIHELCHFLTILALGGRIYTLSLGAYGAKMETDPLHPARELLAALAGPLGSAMLILLARWMPRLAICGMVHCLYNLLPLYPMDGGRALRNFLALWLPNRAGDIVYRAIQWLVVLLLIIGMVIGLRRIWPVVLLIMILWRQRKMRTV